jgi:hypothetical protein
MTVVGDVTVPKSATTEAVDLLAVDFEFRL